MAAICSWLSRFDVRQVGHEFGAERRFDLLENVALHRLHAEHALHDFKCELGGRAVRTRAECSVLILERMTDTVCGYSFFRIVREHLLVHVAKLVPHRATSGATQLFHQAVDLLGRQELQEQAVCLFVGAGDGRPNLRGG